MGTPKIILNGLYRIGMKFFSQMSSENAFSQIVGDVFGGSLVRQFILVTPSRNCRKMMILLCFWVAKCRATINHM
jgi:hypothetical protein